MTQEQYSIGELAAAAGTTPRTVRYYTAEGLLPPPDTQGRYAVYRQEHLLRLQVIARLKETYLPLHVIKARLADVPVVGLEQALQQPNGNAAPETQGVYLPEMFDSSRRIAEAPQPYAASVHVSPSLDDSVSQSYRNALHQSPMSLTQPYAPTFTPHAAVQQGEFWQRITLASGIELNVREPLSVKEREQIERLLAAAKQIFP